jgi:hypothetical protein
MKYLFLLAFLLLLLIQWMITTPDRYNEILSDNKYRAVLIDKVKKCKEPEVSINREDWISCFNIKY